MDGIKLMRAELGMTQSELAAALHVSFTAVNRWENGRAHPNLAAYTLLQAYAKAKGVSQGCLDAMRNSFEITRTRRNTKQVRVEGMQPIDRELLCQLVEEAATAIYVTDAATDELLYANRAVETAIGKSREGMRGQKCYRFLSDADTPCAYCHKKQLRRDKFFESVVESRFDGRLYSVRAKVISWNGRAAHVRYVTSIRNEQVLQNIACGVCIYMIEPDGTLRRRYANAGYYHLFGGNAGSGAAREDHQYGVRAEYRAAVQDFFAAIKAAHKGGELTYRCGTPRGDEKWITVRAAYVADDAGVKDRIYCTYFDVTQSVANRMQLQSILDKAPVAMVVFEVRNKLLHLQYISESCVNITGFTAQETYQRNADDRAADAHPDARRYALTHEWEDLQKKSNLSYTYQVLCKDGSYTHVNLSLSPVETESGTLYYGTLRRVAPPGTARPAAED